MKVYKVIADGNGNWCAYSKLDDALDSISFDLEHDIEGLEIGEETMSFHIEVGEMTQEEYDELPEFGGW